jgi:hypothetical protein
MSTDALPSLSDDQFSYLISPFPNFPHPVATFSAPRRAFGLRQCLEFIKVSELPRTEDFRDISWYRDGVRR